MKMNLLGERHVLAVLLFCALATVGSHGQTFNVLASFNGTNGEQPYYAGLIQESMGILNRTT